MEPTEQSKRFLYMDQQKKMQQKQPTIWSNGQGRSALFFKAAPTTVAGFVPSAGHFDDCKSAATNNAQSPFQSYVQFANNSVAKATVACLSVLSAPPPTLSITSSQARLCQSNSNCVPFHSSSRPDQDSNNAIATKSDTTNSNFSRSISPIALSRISDHPQENNLQDFKKTQNYLSSDNSVLGNNHKDLISHLKFSTRRTPKAYSKIENTQIYLPKDSSKKTINSTSETVVPDQNLDNQLSVQALIKVCSTSNTQIRPEFNCNVAAHSQSSSSSPELINASSSQLSSSETNQFSFKNFAIITKGVQPVAQSNTNLPPLTASFYNRSNSPPPPYSSFTYSEHTSQTASFYTLGSCKSVSSADSITTVQRSPSRRRVHCTVRRIGVFYNDLCDVIRSMRSPSSAAAVIAASNHNVPNNFGCSTLDHTSYLLEHCTASQESLRKQQLVINSPDPINDDDSSINNNVQVLAQNLSPSSRDTSNTGFISPNVHSINYGGILQPNRSRTLPDLLNSHLSSNLNVPTTSACASPLPSSHINSTLVRSTPGHTNMPANSLLPPPHSSTHITSLQPGIGYTFPSEHAVVSTLLRPSTNGHPPLLANGPSMIAGLLPPMPTGSPRSPKPCLHCTQFGARWFVLLVALIGLLCALLGAYLVFAWPSRSDQLPLALLMLGVGIVLIAISALAFRLSTSASNALNDQSPACSSNTAVSDAQRRFLPRPPGSRVQHPYGAMFYPEFEYRPPPPTYQASMQEHRLRLMMMRRSSSGRRSSTLSNLLSNLSGLVLPDNNPLNNNRCSASGHAAEHSAVSPPPTYRSSPTCSSLAGSLRRPPSYRTALNHHRDPPTTTPSDEINTKPNLSKTLRESILSEERRDNITSLSRSEHRPLQNVSQSMSFENLVVVHRQEEPVSSADGDNGTNVLNFVPETLAPATSELQILAHL